MAVFVTVFVAVFVAIFVTVYVTFRGEVFATVFAVGSRGQLFAHPRLAIAQSRFIKGGAVETGCNDL